MPDRRTSRRTRSHIQPLDWNAIRKAAEAGAARRLDRADRDYDDAVQDALMATVMVMDSASRVEAFAFAAAERRAIDILRRSDRQAFDSGVPIGVSDAAGDALQIAAIALDADRGLGARRTLMTVFELIESILTPREREALLRRVDGRAPPAGGRSRSDADRRRDRADAVHVSRARRKLARALVERGHEPPPASWPRRR